MRRPTISSALVWFRDDLRVADNPALTSALSSSDRVHAVYLLDEVGVRPLGGATRWWLRESLRALSADLATLGIPLTVRTGDAVIELPRLAHEAGAELVTWGRRYGHPAAIDERTMAALRDAGVRSEIFAQSLLVEPERVRTGAGTAYAVFTPFATALGRLLAVDPPRLPLPVPPPARERATALPGLALTVIADAPWQAGLAEARTPGEHGAHDLLADFLDTGLAGYEAERDRLDRDVTSRLSPHLRFGEISPQQVEAAIAPAAFGPNPAGAAFSRQLRWREFAHHQLHDFPDLATHNWRDKFDGFHWPEPDPTQLEAWRTGRTGIPLVDAGMRELWATGSMHGRARMVTASFLTKNLLIHWRTGEEWFWDTLVDADAAANPFNWQWIAGSGADAAPYFRIFNPLLQGERFDPQERYVRRWVPEYGTSDYPEPIVDLRTTRARALEAYHHLPR